MRGNKYIRKNKYEIRLNDVNANNPLENGVFSVSINGDLIVGDIIQLITSVTIAKKEFLTLPTEYKKLFFKNFKECKVTIFPMPFSTEDERVKRIEEIKAKLEKDE